MSRMEVDVLSNLAEGAGAIVLAGAALQMRGDRPILMGGRCTACGLQTFPRHPVCPGCMAEDIAEEAMPEHGTVYSLSTIHVGPSRWHKPMTLGYVDLPNGVRVFSHLRNGCRIGETVTLDLAEVGREKDGTSITSFVFRSGRT